MNESIEIRYSVIDPDNGNIIKDQIVAIAFNKYDANMIIQALTEYDYEPNREYYTKSK
jgi:hypothetical protein